MASQQSHVVVALLMLAALLALPGCRGDGRDDTSTESSPDRGQSRSSVTAIPVDETVDRLVGFISPTGNVACMIEPSWARCDIIDRDWSLPPRPADCEFDYGQGISLNAGGPAEFVCAGDTAFGPDEVLPYGSSKVAGALRCESAESGITCRDGQTGHGFSIAREAYRIF